MDPAAALEIVGDFLIRFYHQEPDEVLASTHALHATADHLAYRCKIAKAFRSVLSYNWTAGQLSDLVQHKGNRRAQSEEQAREYLEFVFQDNDMPGVVDLDEAMDLDLNNA